MPSPFKKRRGLILTFVVIIIIVMLFSVFGVVVLYLNGTAQPIVTPPAPTTAQPLLNPTDSAINTQVTTGSLTTTGTETYQVQLGDTPTDQPVATGTALPAETETGATDDADIVTGA